jgi:hypothetical protein
MLYYVENDACKFINALELQIPYLILLKKVMDYIETFKENCKRYLADQTITLSKSPSTSQRKFEFEQALKFKIQELTVYFNGQIENWNTLASKAGQSGIYQNLINEVRTLLREFEEKEKDKFAS